jgi:tRNA-intron endonuclease
LEKKVIGTLKNEHIVIPDKKSSSRLYNRGLYGTPQSGGGLELELIEGFYLLDSEKIQIQKNKSVLSIEEMLTYITKREPTFEIKYIVYRDLRLRGHIVKPSNTTDFIIYGSKADDGTGPGKRVVKYWSLAYSERGQFVINELSEFIETAQQTRKRLIIGVVDEEGDLTYYDISSVSPSGKIKSKKVGKSKKQKYTNSGSAVLVEDRVMLWDTELIKELRKVGFYGKEVGKSLQLSLTESAYLMEEGVLGIKLARTRREVSYDRFIKIARKLQPDFDRRLKVYRELKSRGLIVKTGFKYGAHFRVYEGDPDSEHSEYLVHGVPQDYQCSWEEISRAVRLAHGVRKRMLFARVMDSKKNNVGKIEYLDISRIKP